MDEGPARRPVRGWCRTPHRSEHVSPRRNGYRCPDLHTLGLRVSSRRTCVAVCPVATTRMIHDSRTLANGCQANRPGIDATQPNRDVAYSSAGRTSWHYSGPTITPPYSQWRLITRSSQVQIPPPLLTENTRHCLVFSAFRVLQHGLCAGGTRRVVEWADARLVPANRL